MHRDQPDAIIAAGEVVDLRFKTGNQLSLRAAKLFCLLIQEAGVDVTEDRQHRVPLSVLNETFHLSGDDTRSPRSQKNLGSIALRFIGL